MTHVVRSDTGTVPLILCDHCSKPIEKAGLALAMWKRDGDNLLEGGKVYFSHKACHEKLEGNNPLIWGSSELTDFLRRLVHNAGADISENMGTELLDRL